MKSYPSTLIALLVLLGCSNAPSGSTASSSGTSPSAATTGDTTGNNAETAAPDPSKVPDSLKHDGFAYFGLANDQTMNVELKVKDRPTKTGGVTTKLVKIDGDSATYEMERTGGLAEDLGTDTILVDKTGVYITANSTGTITPPKSLQLPATLKPGTSWVSKSKVSRTDGQELEDNSTFTVKGIQKVKTPVGEYDALLVTSTGTALVKTSDGQKKAKYETTNYYVKDRGLVKAVISMTLEGQKPNEVVIEETK